MKVWLLVLLVQVAPGAEIPLLKTVATIEECGDLLLSALQKAAADRAGIQGKCVPYDGEEEEMEALRVIQQMLHDRELQYGK